MVQGLLIVRLDQLSQIGNNKDRRKFLVQDITNKKHSLAYMETLNIIRLCQALTTNPLLIDKIINFNPNN